MLKIQEIREIIRLIDQSTINEFSFEQDGARIELKKQPGVQLVPASEQQIPQQLHVKQEAVEEDISSATAKIQAQPEPKAERQPEASSEELHTIVSPMVGTYYHSPSPEADPYVKAGVKVEENTVVCIVEAMKLFNEIEAEVKGEIVEILVENGQLVEYGQPLFKVKSV